MIEEFIKQIMKKINEITKYEAYYNEVPKTAVYPYLAVPGFIINTLNSGYSTFLDIEVYINELSNLSPETIIDNLKKELDGFSFSNEKIAFHINFESAAMININEQDLNARKITFDVRFFEKGV